MEEAWLRGYLTLPAGAPDFYEAMPYWCNARWIGPARGYIDPTKEIAANIAAIEAGLMSRSEAIAERGGDFDEISEQLAREKARYTELGFAPAQAAVSVHLDTTEDKDKEGGDEQPSNRQ